MENLEFVIWILVSVICFPVSLMGWKRFINKRPSDFDRTNVTIGAAVWFLLLASIPVLNLIVVYYVWELKDIELF